MNQCYIPHHKTKDKFYIIISTYVKKALYKKEHGFMIKSLNELGIDITHLNIIKAIYGTLMANIILNGKKFKECSLLSHF